MRPIYNCPPIPIMQAMAKAGTMDWEGAVREGIYPVAFAAKLAESTSATVASWFRPTKGAQPPAIMTSFDRLNGQMMIPFLGLVEARFVSRFRKHGLSLQTIRKAATKLRRDYGLDHPFAEKRFRTDGKRVMMEHAADDGERRLIDIMTDEFAFPTVVEPSLFDTVVYIHDIAAAIRPFHEFPNVLIDPRYALGRPIVSQGYVPTATLAASYLAEGDLEGVAEWYGTDAESVTQAVAFEQRLAA